MGSSRKITWAKIVLALFSALFLSNLVFTTVAAQPTNTQANPSAQQLPGPNPGATCESASVFEMSWFICPVLRQIDGSLNWLSSSIDDFLHIDEDEYNNSGRIKAVWAGFRDTARMVFVICFLVMIYGIAVGAGFLEAYSLQKLLPRMIFAVVYIELSWDLNVLLLQIANSVGSITQDLFYAPFFGAGNSPDINEIFKFDGGFSQTSFFVGLLMLIGGAFLGLFAVGFIAMSVFLGLMVAFLTLVLREASIIVLLSVAPLAIASYVLPNTASLFKSWWSLYSKALLMYPLIIAFLSAGTIFAYAAGSTTADTGSVQNSSEKIISVIAYFAPYFLIPMTFQFAGGAISRFAGIANDKTKGLIDGTRKRGQENAAKNRIYAKAGERMSSRNAITRGINTATGFVGSATPRTLVRGVASRDLRGAIRANTEANAMLASATRGEDSIMKAVEMNDAAQSIIHSNSSYKQASSFVDAKIADLAAQRSRGEINSSQYSTGVNSWQQALSLANRVGYSQSSRLAALKSNMKNGYQFAAGEEGYLHMANSAAEILGGEYDAATQTYSGNNAGHFGNLMNELQYYAKGSGRWDLAGLNNGQGFSFMTGWGKATLYEIGNGKKDTIKAAKQHIEKNLTIAGNLGKSTAERVGAIREAQIVYRELEQARPNAKGSVQKEMNRILDMKVSRPDGTMTNSLNLRLEGVQENMVNSGLLTQDDIFGHKQEARIYQNPIGIGIGDDPAERPPSYVSSPGGGYP